MYMYMYVHLRTHHVSHIFSESCTDLDNERKIMKYMYKHNVPYIQVHVILHVLCVHVHVYIQTQCTIHNITFVCTLGDFTSRPVCDTCTCIWLFAAKGVVVH